MSRRERNEERTCYISASAGLDTGSLRRALKELSVQIALEGEAPPPGEALLATLRETLRRVDFVCGVLGAGEGSANVLFELGLAAGLARPVFVVRSGSRSIPVALEGYPLVQAELEDVDALKFHLELFLRNLKRAGRIPVRPQRAKTPHRSQPSLDDLHRRIRPAGRGPESELERVVLEALQRVGIEAVSGPRYGDGKIRPDLAAWLPEMPPDLGNPILIEVVGGLRAAGEVAEQAQGYLEAAGVRSALIVSPAHDMRPIAGRTGGYIFWLSLDEFLAAVEQGNLIQRLVDQRNRLVHGAL